MTFSDFYRNKRVLVTGHTGFKGGWLSIWLKALRADVAGYALPPDTTPNLFSLANVGEGMRHIIGDIRDFDALSAVFDDFQPEIVFHLAAQPLVRASYVSPRETFEVNVQGTVNVLEAVRCCPSVRAVAVVTSDKCYENHEWIFGYRENDPVGGFDPYSAGKGAAELVTRSYARSFFGADSARPVGVATLRAGNVIGGGDFASDRLIPDAVRAALSGEVLQIRFPDSVRPWQFVLEPLGGYLALGYRLVESAGRFSGPWNFGPAESGAVSVWELAERFYAYFENGRLEDISKTSQEKFVHEAAMLRLSTDKARHILGWRGILTTVEAVEAAANWYRHVLIEKMDAEKLCIKDIGEYVEQAARIDAWWAV